MEMTCAMEVLDGTGHVTLTWTPGDAVSLARAREEFDRLKTAGYAFFATPDETTEIERWPKRGRQPEWTTSGALDVRASEPQAERVVEFKPHARRTVAVRPMQGG